MLVGSETDVQLRGSDDPRAQGEELVEPFGTGWVSGGRGELEDALVDPLIAGLLPHDDLGGAEAALAVGSVQVEAEAASGGHSQLLAVDGHHEEVGEGEDLVVVQPAQALQQVAEAAVFTELGPHLLHRLRTSVEGEDAAVRDGDQDVAGYPACQHVHGRNLLETRVGTVEPEPVARGGVMSSICV